MNLIAAQRVVITEALPVFQSPSLLRSHHHLTESGGPA